LNLYLDTSALVKLYVREAGSRSVRRNIAAAVVVATSRVAYAEARAALGRRHREGGIAARGLRRAVRALDRDWPAYALVEASAGVVHRAGALAEARALRGFDAIHLASALELQSLVGTPVTFVAFDARLIQAAAAEGLPTI
jgi:predicted nucleic acid-binding protein